MRNFFSEPFSSCSLIVWGSEREGGEGEVFKARGDILREIPIPRPEFSPQHRQEGRDAPTPEHLPTSTFPTSLLPLLGAFLKVISRAILAAGCWFFPPPKRNLLANTEHIIAACDRSSQPPFSAKGAQSSSSKDKNQLRHKPPELIPHFQHPPVGRIWGRKVKKKL